MVLRKSYDRKRFSPKKIILVGVLALAAISITLLILELTNTTHYFHKQKIAPQISAGQATKGESNGTPVDKSAQTPAPTNSTTPQPGDTKSNSSSGTTTNLLAPSGAFVSNHHPNLSGSPAPNTMSSVCTTSPGASCAINFTKNGVTKSLATQTTDREGSIYWAWKLQDIGLTAGTWTVVATATLNGQSQSTSDALGLAIAQ